MPRPNKEKYIGKLPAFRQFTAEKGGAQDGTQDNAQDGTQDDTQGGGRELSIAMSLEEFETVRLIDYLNGTQAEAAKQMGVGRGTVQALYTSARRKLARYLVEGTCLRIDGGNYFVNTSPVKKEPTDVPFLGKGALYMKLAVTYENGQVFQHFGHTSQFKIYTIADGKITSSAVVDTNGSGHGALAGFLKDLGVDTLICGGIGAGAKNALAEAGIKLYAGAVGSADAQAESFLAGNLVYDPNTECHHHGEGHENGGCHHSEGHGNGGCHHGERHGNSGCHHGEGHGNGGCHH